MLRTLARRGASVLVAAAVLGGGLALGVGTASAEGGPAPIVVPLSGWTGSVANLAAGSVSTAAMAGGSIDSQGIWPFLMVCALQCTGTHSANEVEILLNLLQGTDPDRVRELLNDTPDDLPFSSADSGSTDY